jgi:Flp pilus assembly protein CpaB
MRRNLYLAAFTVLALATAGLVLRSQQTVAVVVATRDLRAGARVGPGDVEERGVHADSVPPGALTAPETAVGAYVAWPLAQGEPVLARMLSVQPSGAAVAAGLVPPEGERALAVPVQPTGAVGGVLAPGDHVDVYATPGGAVAAADEPPAGVDRGGGPAAAILLGSDLVVLQLRSDQGQALDQLDAATAHGLAGAAPRLGSVVLAVPAGEVGRYAAAAARGALYLALRMDRQG